jgi:hypothetical protein
MATMRIIWLCLAALAATVGAGELPTAKDYLGKWDLVIVNTGDTFKSCTLDLAARDGALLGEMVWRWGSVWEIKDPKIARVDAQGALSLRRDDWAEPLVLARHGHMLEGKVKEKNGNVFYLVGTRAGPELDVAGAWDITIARDDDGLKSFLGTLKITTPGPGVFAAQACSPQGQANNDMTITDMKTEGNCLSFSVRSKENDGRIVTTPIAVTVTGDSFTGPVKGPGDATLAGVRRRPWGEPVKLLAENGLAGWHGRDDRRGFEWSCENGVLTNKAGTMDIVSDRVFKDFKLHLEYMVDKNSNSGVYLRGRYEVQIVDDFGAGVESHGNGAVYSRIPQKKNVSKAPNTWQTYDLTLIGRYVTVVLNGETIIANERLNGITGGALDPFEALPGPLMLQGDHGKVWYRNVVVTPALNE